MMCQMRYVIDDKPLTLLVNKILTYFTWTKPKNYTLEIEYLVTKFKLDKILRKIIIKRERLRRD
jgi:hypothetical protein